MKALVLFSGGVDSTTCLALAIDRYGKENVVAYCYANEFFREASDLIRVDKPFNSVIRREQGKSDKKGIAGGQSKGKRGNTFCFSGVYGYD